MAKRKERTANGGRYTLPAWNCRSCGSGRVVQLSLGTRHASCCADCDQRWGDQYVLDVVTRSKRPGVAQASVRQPERTDRG